MLEMAMIFGPSLGLLYLMNVPIITIRRRKR